MDVPHEADGGPSSLAVLLFGWCTQIRSNGRIPVALHRVVNQNWLEVAALRRRMSAVLFGAPISVETRFWSNCPKRQTV
jgi:hypothetical protein